MYTFILTLILLASVLLVLSVLAQSPKGGGLAGQFGGSSVTQLMGVKKTTDILEKVTWIMASVIIVLAIVANIMLNKAVGGADEQTISPNIEEVENTPTYVEDELPFLEEEESAPVSAPDTTTLEFDALPE